MVPDDSKQILIYELSTSRLKREERGCLAKAETIRVLKEKTLPGLHAYVVQYTSTTQQQWDEARCFFQSTHRVAELPNTSGAGQQWDETNDIPRATLNLRRTSFGLRGKTENRTVTSEAERIEHGSQSWMKFSAGESSGYWLIYGVIIANGHDVAFVRMIHSSGQIEDDEVQHGCVLFLSQCSSPIWFELYSPSRTLVGKQLWEFNPVM